MRSKHRAGTEKGQEERLVPRRRNGVHYPSQLTPSASVEGDRDAVPFEGWARICVGVGTAIARPRDVSTSAVRCGGKVTTKGFAREDLDDGKKEKNKIR